MTEMCGRSSQSIQQSTDQSMYVRILPEMWERTNQKDLEVKVPDSHTELKAGTELAQILESADKDIKIIIIVYTFKKAK